MTPPAATTANRHEARGLLLGFVGVLIFSLTLPMTRIAVVQLDPWLIGLGRALVAAVPAALYLAWRRAPRPSRSQRPALAAVVAGVIIGFPVCSSIGMKTVPAAHGAIVIGVLPLATALFAAALGGERPSPAFWLFAFAGSAVVLHFALTRGGGGLSAGDAWLLAAVVLGALGYAEGGRLARSLGGPEVICWALVASAPILAAPVGWLAWRQPWPIELRTALAFGYVALFSQFLGFFAWYRGLAEGGLARVGQVQLLQVFMTIGFAALLFGELVDPTTWAYAAAVVALVAAGRLTTIRRST
ncbi:MAG TPA: DMT family transporter [Burkholderiaceae bacterium]|nr:DMT family transporter [Burkholderiaceae bacterium]